MRQAAWERCSQTVRCAGRGLSQVVRLAEPAAGGHCRAALVGRSSCITARVSWVAKSRGGGPSTLRTLKDPSAGFALSRANKPVPLIQHPRSVIVFSNPQLNALSTTSDGPLHNGIDKPAAQAVPPKSGFDPYAENGGYNGGPFGSRN